MLKSWLIMRSPLPTDYTINPDWGQPYVVAEQNKTAAGQSKTKQNETKQNKTNITSGRINSFEPGKKPGKVTLQTLFVVLYWLCGIKQEKEISPAFAGGGTECFWMGRTTPRLTGWSQALLVARPCSLGWSQTTFAARPCNPDGVEKI